MTDVALRAWIEIGALLRATHARVAGPDAERGDVPGWVLVTIMTAGLVTVLWAVAGDRLQDIFSSALDSVTGPGA